MKKTLRQITATLLGVSLSFLSIPAFAEDVPTEEIIEEVVLADDATQIIELTLEEAIAMAIAENPQIAANDAAIKSAELSLEVAKDKKKDYANMEKMASKIPGMSMAVNVSSGLEQAYLKHGYYVTAANTGYDLALMDKEKSIASISYDVTQKYYNVKLIEKLIGIAEMGLELARDNAEVVKTSFELGLVSQLEVKNVENAVKKSENSLESYKRNYTIASDSLKISLQIDEKDCTLKLTDEITDIALPEGVDEKISSALLTRYDVTALKKSMELKEELFNITKKYVSDSTAMYHSAYSDYLLADYTYKNTSKLIALSLKNEYNAILEAKENILACESDLEIKNIEYESDKIKYEMGLITNIELTGSMAALDSSRVQLENARLTYLMAVMKFNYNTTIGI